MSFPFGQLRTTGSPVELVGNLNVGTTGTCGTVEVVLEQEDVTRGRKAEFVFESDESKGM